MDSRKKGAFEYIYYRAENARPKCTLNRAENARPK